MPSLLGPFEIGVPNFSLLLAASLILSILVTFVHGFLILGNPWRLLRPAFIFAIFLTIFFQWPSVLMADAIRHGLNNPWLFWTSIHIVPMALAGWIFISPKLDMAKGTISKPNYSWAALVLPIVLMVLFSSLYLLRVPFDCTALFAVMYDPTYTLLARELSIKLSGSALAAYSYGALANVVAPVVIALSIPLAIRSSSFKSVHWLVLSISLVVSAIVLVLLSGAKGLLIPSALFVISSAFVWNRGALAKLSYFLIAFGILTGGLVAFELVKERPSPKQTNYQFGSCVSRLNACAAVAPLIPSLTSREWALGLALPQIKLLDTEWRKVCPAESEHVPALQDRELEIDLPEAGGSSVPGASYDLLVRAYGYVFALAERALITPIRVASWYFLYVAEYGHPGVAAMPFGEKLAGHKVNMPIKVYQEYGVVFSGGDATSTSTAPTSFIFTYPANLGAIGLLLAVVLVIALDILCMIFVLRLPVDLLGIASGISLVIALNMIVSDFVTILGSHGGAVAVALLAFLSVVHGNLTGRKVGWFGERRLQSPDS